MKLIVNPHKIQITKEPINEREINITKCEFEFAEEITNDYVKEAYFTLNDETYKQIIFNNECDIPSEVLEKKGTVQIGVVAYLVENEEEIKRYNPSPAYFDTWIGSLKDNAENSEPITPSEMEQFEQELHNGLSEVNDKLDEMNEALTEVDNLDIDVTKSGNVSTVTITNKEGITKSEEIVDGAKGDKGADAKINGVNTLTIEAGDNITLDQEGSTLTINSTASGGTFDYTDLTNKPSINNVTLSGNKSLNDLGIQPKGNYALENDIPDVSSFITKDVNNLTNYTLKTNTGSLIDLEINDTTYVVTLKLKNQDGTIISTDTIDLPLESVVVSGRYDNTTKKVILTLENGSEVDFSVADLVAGLQTEITSQNKLASDLIDDTNSGNKFVTTSEKQTWNNKYDKPNGGIPKTDLASDVRTSLGKADTALQEHQDISGKEDKTNKVTSIDNTSTDTQYPSAKCVYDNQEEQNTEIEKLQTENVRLKSTIPTTTGSGEEVTLEKTTELDFVKPPLPRGNTKQNTTTGKNLLNTSNANTTTVNGVTSYRSNGFYYLSGTNTKTDATWVLPNTQNTNLPTFEIGQTYTMSFKGTLPNGIYAQLNGFKAGTQYSIGIVRNTVPSITFTIDSDYSSTAQLFIGIQGTTTNADCNFAIQIEKGSTATSYEPYTGGIPSPNPGYPQEVEVVTGNVEVTISNENNTESKTLPVSLGNIELCKIGDYQDYLYKNNGKWYVHKNTIKIDLSTITSYIHTPGWRNLTAFVADNVFNHGYSGYTTVASLFCNRLIADTPARITGSVINAIGLGRNTSIYISVEGITTSNALITYFSQNPTYLYAPLATPTSTEITDATLISQLEEISKTLSYQGQTNITSNTIALFDVEAYQSTKLILEDLDLTKLSTFDSTKTQVLKNINGTLTWVNE